MIYKVDTCRCVYKFRVVIFWFSCYFSDSLMQSLVSFPYPVFLNSCLLSGCLCKTVFLIVSLAPCMQVYQPVPICGLRSSLKGRVQFLPAWECFQGRHPMLSFPGDGTILLASEPCSVSFRHRRTQTPKLSSHTF